MGRTIPDLKLSLQLKRHVCIELSYLDPRIVRRVRPLPGMSRRCAVMINSLENPIHINLLEELRKRQVRLRLKRARTTAKLPPPLLECRSGQPFEELWSDRQGLGSSEHAKQRSFFPLRHKLGYGSGTRPRWRTGTAILAGDQPHRVFFRSTFVHQRYCTAWNQTALAERPLT